ncbi:Heme exporter protein B [invertebrate metagenome]|uniref:Heme exporter protein B n=1 Tax=invertebrate metagenome TaxID=1711999 RepID=A0A2H9T5Q2_9ZZZZ
MGDDIRVVMIQVTRDLRIAWRSPGQILNPLLFFLVVGALFPLGITPEPALLAKMAGGIIWIGALLSVLLTLDRLFKNDHDDGSLQQLLTSPCPLPLLVMGKLWVHWLTTGFFLVLISPLLALMMHLSLETLWSVIGGLLLGTPVLTMLGAIGAALVVQLQRGGGLISVLVLPLYIPVLIFGSGAIEAAQSGFSYRGHLLWLGVFFMLAICLAPLAITGALRIVSDRS